MRIIDGDTFELAGEKVRISNIDAPELPPHAKCWAEAALAVQAASKLREFINVSPSLTLKREGRDRYGRTLARVVLVGNADVGEALVTAGYAAQWTGRRWDWCGPAHYQDAAGPSFETGPMENRPFNEWMVKRVAAPVGTN